MDGKKIYTEQIKPIIDDFNNKINAENLQECYKKMTKEVINEMMDEIIPKIKDVYNYNNRKDCSHDPYIKGMSEAYAKTTRISVRTTDKNKISSFIFDIGDYVDYWVYQYKQ